MDVVSEGPYPYWKKEPPPHIGAQVDQIAAHTADVAADLLDSYMKFSLCVDRDDPARAHEMYLAFLATVHRLTATPDYDWVPLIGQLCDSILGLAMRQHGSWNGIIEAVMRGDLIHEATGENDGSASHAGE